MSRALVLSLLFAGAAALQAGKAAPALRLHGGSAKSPPETYQAYVAIGTKQGTMATTPLVLQSLYAGFYIALGSALALTVGAAMPGIKSSNIGLQKILLGAFGLPWALLMVLLTGGQLFTGNTALVTAAMLEGKVTRAQIVYNWVVSYFGNFVGCLCIALALVGAGLFGPESTGAINIALAKTSLSWGAAFIRGFLCNWMVCIAIWQATCAGSLPGKFIGVFLPISSFVALGFEHSIANMAMIPLGMLCGADISVSKFISANLIPVTLGNALSGALMVAYGYHLVHGSGLSEKA